MYSLVELQDIHNGIAVSAVKEELEDHLDAINSNTNEIMSNYEYICQLDARLSKVEEKIEELLLSAGVTPLCKYKGFKMPHLTKNEQELFDFLLLQGKPSSYKEIALKLALTQQILSDYITNLIEKGIPLLKRYSSNDILIYMDPKFQQEEIERRTSTKKINLVD